MVAGMTDTSPTHCPFCKSAVVKRKPVDRLGLIGGNCECGKTIIDLSKLPPKEAQAHMDAFKK